MSSNTIPRSPFFQEGGVTMSFYIRLFLIRSSFLTRLFGWLSGTEPNFNWLSDRIIGLEIFVG